MKKLLMKPKQNGKSRSLLRRTILIVSLVFISVLCISFLSSNHVFAADDTSDVVETTFFGNVKDDGQGCGVFMILNLVVDILTGAIGIVSVVGIIIVGIQYLTAGDNEQQVTKARRRIAEIILGLATFAVLYAVAQWLLPGGKLSTNNACTTISDEELAKAKQKEKEQKASKEKTSSSAYTAKLANGKTITISKDIAKVYTAKQLAKKINKGKTAPPSKVCTNCSWSERIAQTAEYLAWQYDTTPSTYKYPYGRATKGFQNALEAVDPNHSSSFWDLGADCGTFVGVVIRYSGYDPQSTLGCQGHEDFYANKPKLWKEIPVSQAQRGDVCIRGGCHTVIVIGKNRIAEAHNSTQEYGHISAGTCASIEFDGNKPKVYRAIPK